MRELRRCGPHSYIKIEDPNEISSFTIFGDMDELASPGTGFEFFRGLGIIGYAKTFKIWLRKFPRPVFIAAVDRGVMISWVFIEAWGETARDGSPVWVLRAIESLPTYRRRRIGYRLLLLGLQQTMGYMITKPLTPDADRFFRRAGFMDEKEFSTPPIDLSRHPGYLILPPYRRKKLLDEMERFFKFVPEGEEALARLDAYTTAIEGGGDRKGQ
ncbi:MAG: hypothetical protein AB1665_07420 [Candidatus Thermoplasmatota archaeon]